VYIGLLTYRHAAGPAGGQLPPGLAEALPQRAVAAQGDNFQAPLAALREQQAAGRS